MPLMGPSVFILGLMMARTMANDNASVPQITLGYNGQNFNSNDGNDPTAVTHYETTSISSSTSNMNITTASSIVTTGVATPDIDKASSRPSRPSKITLGTTTTTKSTSAGDPTGIIFISMIIIVAIVAALACYCVRKRERRYSVDFTSRQDDANIPLSNMEPELLPEPFSQNGLKTFESTESAAKEPQEPEAKPEVQEDQKTEADAGVAEPTAESADPAPPPDSPGEGAVGSAAEPPPPPPPAPVEEKTDDEGGVSNQTSMESLKEANDNNSNNADLSQRRDLESSGILWDVPLNCPV